VRPGIAFVPVPVLWPGERTSTEDEPARTFYAGLAGVEGGAVWDASFQVGYVWADEPRATAAAIVTGTDRDTIAAAATGLAQRYWDLRHDFTFGMTTLPVAACVARALAATSGLVILADSGDNPTGGGVGDRADLLAALLAAGAPDAIVAGIADRPATDAAYIHGVGATLSLSVGATLDPQSRPVTLTATVASLFVTEDPRERQAVLRTGGIRLVVTARRRPFHNLADFACLGLDPARAALVVVKSGYLSPELAPLANPGLMALSPGVVDQDIPRIACNRRIRPVFPWDNDPGWRPVIHCNAPHG
jgi:microcystin degradation protein MlrC